MSALIYNVTTKVATTISTEWLKWMNEVHIPEIISTGCFTHATILRLLEVEEDEGPTYAVQYHSPSMKFYQEYLALYATEMKNRVSNKWGEQVISFRSLLEVVNWVCKK